MWALLIEKGTIQNCLLPQQRKKQSTSQQEAAAPMLNIDGGFIYCIVAWLEAADVAT